LPKKTAKAIIDSGNNYFLSVKGNQEALHECLKQQCVENKEIDEYKKREKNKGRKENREIKVYNLDIEHPVVKEWVGATIGVKIRRWGVRKEKGKEKKYDETWYYISNKLHSAKDIYKGNRAHWRVESMHWVKDVVLGEDASKIKKGNAPGNYSMIRSVVCNILNFNGFKSIKSAIRGLANNIKKIWELVNS